MRRRDETQARDADRSGRDADFEAAVGARIHAARVSAGMTQRTLSDAVGIAYQKLQKYELGRDRIAISTLNRIAKALNLHPGLFFEDRKTMPVVSPSTVKMVKKSAALLQDVRDPRVAKTLLALIRELGEKGGDAEEDQDVALPPAPTGRSRRGRMPVEPSRAVVDPLLELLKQTGTGDAGALAQLLGQALAEAEKLLRRR